MLVKIKRDTVVRVAKDTVIDLPPVEVKRLVSLGNAEPAEAKKTKKK